MRPSFTVAVGVQDGSFEAFQRGIASTIQYTPLCLTKVSGTVIQEVKIDFITVDGLDATNKLLKNLNGWNYDVVILGGATFAGFNVVDVKQVYNKIKRPIIVFSLKNPDMGATLNALRKHFQDWETRWSRYLDLGALHELRMKDKISIFFEVVGESKKYAEEVLTEQAIYGRAPEAIRLANLIAKGVSSVFQDQVVSHCESSD